MANRKPVFNGHTWIVVTIIIITLAVLGIGAEFGLFYLLCTRTADELSGLEALGVPAIPYIVIKGVIHVMDVMMGEQSDDKKE